MSVIKGFKRILKREKYESLIKFSYICIFTIYFDNIHIDCTKTVLCQYLLKLIWLLLEMIKLRYININLCTNDSENQTKVFPGSRQYYHQNEVCYHVNIMHYSVTYVQLNPLLSLLLFYFSSCTSSEKNQTCLSLQFSSLSILSNWEDQKEKQRKNAAYFDRSL